METSSLFFSLAPIYATILFFSLERFDNSRQRKLAVARRNSLRLTTRQNQNHKATASFRWRLL